MSNGSRSWAWYSYPQESRQVCLGSQHTPWQFYTNTIHGCTNHTLVIQHLCYVPSFHGRSSDLFCPYDVLFLWFSLFWMHRSHGLLEWPFCTGRGAYHLPQRCYLYSFCDFRPPRFDYFQVGFSSACTWNFANMKWMAAWVRVDLVSEVRM